MIVSLLRDKRNVYNTNSILYLKRFYNNDIYYYFILRLTFSFRKISRIDLFKSNTTSL